MKYLLLTAFLYSACQTTPPLKDCSVLMKEVIEAHRRSGRTLVDGGSEPGLSAAVFWDGQSPTAHLEILASEDYKLPKNNDLKEAGACAVPGESPDEAPKVWKHWQKELPVTQG